MSARKHGISVVVTARRADGYATEWRARCGHHAEWFGPTYEAVEDEWRKHVHAEMGFAPKPMGDKVDRWMPGGAA